VLYQGLGNSLAFAIAVSLSHVVPHFKRRRSIVVKRVERGLG